MTGFLRKYWRKDCPWKSGKEKMETKKNNLLRLQAKNFTGK